VLEELGLDAAIRRQAKLLTRHTGMQMHLDLPESIGPLDHDLEVALYRSVQEALHNVAKHSQAKKFSVQLTLKNGRVSLTVEDDGVGFLSRSSQERGFGLTGMRERTAALGGSMHVRSRPEEGTRIRITFPITPGGKRARHAGRPLTHRTAA
jgi:two-component system sensor histidine kinase UhpB